MLKTLVGKTALITGAALRIGRGIALDLAAGGVNIIIHYHTSERESHELVNLVGQCGVRAFLLQGDLNELSKTDKLIDEAFEQAGDIDFLINSASIFPRKSLRHTAIADIYENLNVNALSPLLLARSFFLRKKTAGHIINILDATVTGYDKEHWAYHLSKRVLFDLTRMMSLEFAPGFLVNAIAPGLILPPKDEPEASLSGMVSLNPLLKHGSQKDINEAVIFLLRSDFITGQVVFVDGGQHLKANVYGL